VQSGASPGNGRHVLPSKLVWVPISRLVAPFRRQTWFLSGWRPYGDCGTTTRRNSNRRSFVHLYSAQGPQDDDLVDGFVPGGLTGSFSVVPQGLNPSQFWALFGMTATACGKIGRRRGDRTSGAEAGFLRSLYGTAQAVPLQN
jgi:hypothetical protein